MDEQLVKKMNDIMNDYINYLYKANPIFLYNAEFFYELNHELQIKIDKIEFEKIKMNALDTFNLVKEFYEKYHSDEIEEVNKLFQSGAFNIYYFDELKEEKIYVDSSDWRCYQGVRDGHPHINLSLNGDIYDFQKTVHEIRHQLNYPIEGRSPSNDNLTEGISIFDELIALDFLNEKMGDITNILKNDYIFILLENIDYVSFVCKLVYIKDKLGYITLENYELLYDDKEKENFIKNCGRLFNNINSYEQINAEKNNWYIFGVFIAMFMYKKYKEDNSYLAKFQKLNQLTRKNVYLSDCLKAIDIDLYDDNIIETLRSNLIEETNLIKEQLENVNKI